MASLTYAGLPPINTAALVAIATKVKRKARSEGRDCTGALNAAQGMAERVAAFLAERRMVGQTVEDGTNTVVGMRLALWLQDRGKIREMKGEGPEEIDSAMVLVARNELKLIKTKDWPKGEVPGLVRRKDDVRSPTERSAGLMAVIHRTLAATDNTAATVLRRQHKTGNGAILPDEYMLWATEAWWTTCRL